MERLMMLTDPSTRTVAPVTARTPERAGAADARTIVIVNGDDRVVYLLDAVVESGHYDIVFVESTAHAYSQIKRLRPNLVVICTRLGEMDGFQVLTMLKLDEQTRSIPVLTYAAEYEGREGEDEAAAVEADVEAFAPAPAGRPN
jgi:CheY-like chemotaxis protein